MKIYSKKISHYSLPINIGTYPCCPAAEIEVWIAKVIEKKPKLELELNTYWDGRLGHTSKIYLTIRNTGDAAFSEGNVTISISGLRIADEQELSRQALTYNPSEEKVMRRWNVLLAGKSLNITLSVKAPLSSNRSSFTINAKAYFKDFKGNIYTATKSKTVELLNTLQIKKTITSSTILGEKTYGEIDKVFGLGRIVIVNIYVKNIQSYAVRSVVLDDMIMENFVLVNSSITPNPKLKNNKLQWVFDLNASETKEFRYELIPQKTGSFTAPAAIAHWNEFGITKTASSNTPATRVYGVFVVVSKKTDKHALKIDESFNVTVMLENIGDFPVGINVTDILPKNSTFVS
ncbi:MAG TPA: hypothetical protein EYP23_00755, partial [Thermoplasmata archaeon]|nr:hypothetical protein [Thermoplasmata archaeon]